MHRRVRIRLQLFEDLISRFSREALLLRHVPDQRIPLDLRPRGVQKDPQIIAAGVVVGIHDVGQAHAGLVDQGVVLQSVGDHSHPLREVALVEDRAVPGEDHGGVLYFALLHGVREILQNAIVQARLLLIVKDLSDRQGIVMNVRLVRHIDRLILRVSNAAADDRVHSVQVSRHESSCHLLVLRISLEDLPCGLLAVIGVLHIPVVVGNRQALVLCNALRDLQHASYGVLGLVEAQCPQTGDNLHTVVGLRHFKGSGAVTDRFADACQKLVRHPVHGVDAADAGPCGDGALNA